MTELSFGELYGTLQIQFYRTSKLLEVRGNETPPPSYLRSVNDFPVFQHGKQNPTSEVDGTGWAEHTNIK
ncbi:hypothetical protein H6P81_020628 [Aristolochia fimbriata]|uniref:Uncharacterized protein n=1 Tax=Aristolochia fimbriata TaxID=158543 RepID=A0AAV7DZ80_ARIFI|nr:hypothetical protein H6P81_020628 [Aristolochia fimbriata]